MESQTHIDLVKTAYEYIKCLVPVVNHCLIETDSSGNCSTTHIIGNFVPDVYYQADNLLIIGEAKTSFDFERKHSKEQYEAYFLHCKSFPGQAILVISIPWQLIASAKNFFRRKRLQKHFSFEIVILDELGRCFKV